MSNAPDGLMPANEPPRVGPCVWTLLPGMTHWLANTDPACAQWNTVGSCLPTNFAYAAASYHDTSPTGNDSWPAGGPPPSHVAGPDRPVRSTSSLIPSSHGIT